MMITKIVAFTEKTSIDILALRQQVFTLEQGVSAELDIDGKDDAALHCVIYAKEKLIATGRLLKDGHIGRVAVLADARLQGIGNKAMQALEDTARKRGDKQLFLHAQLSAVGFYKKRGYTSYGDVFLDADIEHIAMRKKFS